MTAPGHLEKPGKPPGKSELFPIGCSRLFPGQAGLSGLAAYRRRALGLRGWFLVAGVCVPQMPPMFHMRQTALYPLSEKICSQSKSMHRFFINVLLTASFSVPVCIWINERLCGHSGKQVMLRYDALHAASVFYYSCNRYNETLYEHNGKHIPLLNDTCTRQDTLSQPVRRGRAAMGRRPEGLPSGERQNAWPKGVLARISVRLLDFVLLRRLTTTPKTAPAAHKFELYANPVPQEWGPGGSSPWWG